MIIYHFYLISLILMIMLCKIFIITPMICIFVFIPIHTWSKAPVLQQSAVFDFDSLSIDIDEVRHTFILHPNENIPIQIKNVYSTCDQVQILSYPREVYPHEEGRLEVRFFPSTSGTITCEVVLEIENPSPSALHYTLKGNVEGDVLSKTKNHKLTKVPDKLITRKLKRREPDLTIALQSVLEKLKGKQEIILVDVRNRGEFEKFRIPGSINLPLFSLKTKSSLKSKSLILVNEGYSYSQMEHECKKLRDADFTAFILNGGLYGWIQNGQALEGDVFTQKNLNRIPAQVFLTEKDYANWIMIDATHSNQAEARYLLPQGIRLPLLDSPKQFISKLKDIINKHKEDTFLSILIFDDNGETYEKLENLFQEAKIKNIFFLEGGFMAYKGVLERQAVIWQGKDNPRKRIKNSKECKSCP